MPTKKVCKQVGVKYLFQIKGDVEMGAVESCPTSYANKGDVGMGVVESRPMSYATT